VPAHDPLCVITRPAPRVPVEAFLALPIEGERLLWDDGTSACAGRGAAARVEASGDGRFRDVRRLSDQVFASIREIDGGGAGALRLFGGFAFEPQRAPQAPWTGFADASFVLPRFSYCTSATSAVLRVVAPASALRGAEDRLASIAQGLERAREPSCLRPHAARPARLMEMARPDWDALVRGALHAIRSGGLEKVVAARTSAVTLDAPIDLPSALARMRRLEPSCMRFVFERERSVFLGASPERLAVLAGAVLEADALAGSISRREGEDDAEIAALRASEKDGREHAHVVDGIRAALGPFCADLEAPARPAVRSLRAVHHLWTPIRAIVGRSTHILDLVEAIHPTPAVCGLPRDRARDFIAAHEPAPRGWYASPVGWFDADGQGQFAVAIRSALVRATDAWLFAGAGIVEGSEPGNEYRETGVKQTTMLAALEVGR
jgi:menaquinone-specific isochorismate synthase